MPIKTKQYQVATWDCLTTEQQQKVKKHYSDICVDSLDWWENIYNDAEMVGLKITSFDLHYSTRTGYFIGTAKDTATKILKEHGAECDTYKITTIEEIKKAVDSGLDVRCDNNRYVVLGHKPTGRYYIVDKYNASYSIGLHGKPGTDFENVLNGTHFYIKE